MSESNKLAEYFGFEVVYPDGFGCIQEEGEQGPEIKREATLEERTMWTVLVRLSAELDALKAAMGEPVAWICEEQTIGPAYGKKRLTFSKYYSDNPLHYKHTPLYTHPAPQQEPLTDEQIDGVYRDVWSTVTHSKRLIALARAVEAAHNIGEKK